MKSINTNLIRIKDIYLKYIYKNHIGSLIFFGILLRFFVFLLYQHVTIFPDSDGYIELGNLLYNQDLSGYDGRRSPGYPLLFVLGNNNINVVICYQFIIGIVASIYFYKTLLLLEIDSKIALIIALLLNCFLHVIFYETAILTESLSYFFISIVFYYFFKYYLKDTTLKRILFLSSLLGILVFIKPFYLYIGFLFYGFTVITDFKFSKICNIKILVLIIPVLTFLGWSYVNKINTNYFVPTTFYGFNTSQNCVNFAEKAPKEYALISSIYVKNREIAKSKNKDVAMTIWFAYDELIKKTNLSFVDLSYELNEFSKATIYKNPKDYFIQVLSSWVAFWKVGIYWNYTDFKVPFANKFFIGIWYIQSTVLQILKILFVILIPFQIIKFIKTRKITNELLITIVILTTSILQALVTYGDNYRFSYPFEFLMVIVVFLFLKKTFERK